MLSRTLIVLTISTTVLASAPPPGPGAGTRGRSWWVEAGTTVLSPGDSASSSNSGGDGNSCHSFTGVNGESYVQCDTGPNGQANLFQGVVPGDPAAPAITPEMLVDDALRLLQPPSPLVSTAPPRGKDGYVGLREFFWVAQSQWHPISRRVTVGPVWAEVTGIPVQLTLDPGAGQPGATCKGPGLPYDPKIKPEAQKSDCHATFVRSSAGLSGSHYTVTVSIQWAATWTGSSGVGGALAPLTTSTTFPLRIAEGQALIQKGLA